VRDINGGGPFGWEPGDATDDTDLTRAVALAYVDALATPAPTSGFEATVTPAAPAPSPESDVAVIAGEYMLKWFKGEWPGRISGERPRDIGNATAVGLERFEATRDPDQAGAGAGSAGNGSLMRCIPTAIFQPDTTKRIQDSMRISKITHNDVRCTRACAVYNEIAYLLINGKSPKKAVEMGHKLAQILEKQATNPPVVYAIQHAQKLSVKDMAENGPKELPNKGAGFVLESLIIAIAAVLDERPLEDVLVDVVSIGKDTDSNAAIAGGLLGARDGWEAIPERWRSKLQFGKEFEEIVKELLRE
jgi:ADP-ribosylglycohydrolase